MSEKERIINKIREDKTRHINFDESFGGSENQFRLLMKYVPDECFKNINLILNNSDPSLLEDKRLNIFWNQHFVNQKEIMNFKDRNYLDRLDYIVFNSNWNFEKFQYQFKVPESKCLVIRNAVEKINTVKKSKEKIKLIYHSTPWRGLRLLLNVFKKIKKKNVELNVCSSTEIYGRKFFDSHNDKYIKLFDECKKIDNLNYFGFKKNNEIIELLKSSHIFSFPSIWPETSCIAAIEALSAGCDMVSTNLGALYETCTPFATFVNFDSNLENLEKKFIYVLSEKIEKYWDEKNQLKLDLQVKTFENLYSWDVRKNEWIDFLIKSNN